MQYPKKGRYRHFKGGEYELLWIARHSETDEPMVVYRALYACGDTPNGDRIWVRPLSMWTEEVERDGQHLPRFAYVGDEAAPVPTPGPAYSIFSADDAELWGAPAAPLPEPMPMPEPEPVPMPVRRAASLAQAAFADKRTALKQVYGYDSFRPGQEELIDAILSGREVLGVMPTGAGKSICYQIPALTLPGCAIVISPLISLMKDQVGQLVQAGVSAAYLNSSLTERQLSLAMDKAAAGAYRIIYVAPERLNTPRFLRLCQGLDISLVAVDEAHCISQWGQDFRPSYLEIPNFLAALGRRPRVCAFTATATQRVREDIVRLLALQSPFERVTGFDRPNLYFKVLRPQQKKVSLLGLLEKRRGQSGIVYCATRKDVENICALLNANGISATRYHAGLEDAERQANQEDFTYDRKSVMVATNAFGMGIDKADVRFVIHYSMPGDLESYYQEAGRAGRDGDRADCLLLYSKQDEMTQRFFIDRIGEESDMDAAQIEAVKEAARARLDRMIAYCRTTACLRATILEYFGEAAPEDCGFCGNCVEATPISDVTRYAVAVLECVQSLNGRYGQALIARLLIGSKDKRLEELHLLQHPLYGSLRELGRAAVNDLIGQLLEGGYLLQRGDKYPVLALGAKAQGALHGGEVVYAHLRVAAQEEGKQPSRPAAGAENLSAGDQALYEELRAVRTRLAASRSVPAYVIFNDAALRGMCQRRPHTSDELLEVSGVGLAKMRAYGADFLRAIRRFEQSK